MTEKEYRPIEHANKLGVPICSGLLPDGPDGVYDVDHGVVVVRQGINETTINIGLAEAMAAHDIALYGPSPVHGTDVRAIAVARLLPDDAFAEAYQALGGGVSALSRFFNLPPVIIRQKLEDAASHSRPTRAPLRIVRNSA